MSSLLVKAFPPPEVYASRTGEVIFFSWDLMSPASLRPLLLLLNWLPGTCFSPHDQGQLFLEDFFDSAKDPCCSDSRSLVASSVPVFF